MLDFEIYGASGGFVATTNWQYQNVGTVPLAEKDWGNVQLVSSLVIQRIEQYEVIIKRP